jgi:hypothetical protein
MKQSCIFRSIDLVAFQKGLEVQGYTEEQMFEIGTALSGATSDLELILLPIKLCKIKNEYCIHVYGENNPEIDTNACEGEYCEHKSHKGELIK